MCLLCYGLFLIVLCFRWFEWVVIIMTELAVQLRHAKRNQANCLDLQQRMLTFLPK